MRYWSYIFRGWIDFAGSLFILFGGIASLVYIICLILKHFA